MPVQQYVSRIIIRLGKLNTKRQSVIIVAAVFLFSQWGVFPER